MRTATKMGGWYLVCHTSYLLGAVDRQMLHFCPTCRYMFLSCFTRQGTTQLCFLNVRAISIRLSYAHPELPHQTAVWTQRLTRNGTELRCIAIHSKPSPRPSTLHWNSHYLPKRYQAHTSRQIPENDPQARQC